MFYHFVGINVDPLPVLKIIRSVVPVFSSFASKMPTFALGPVTKPVLSALNEKDFAVYERFSEFFSGFVVDPLHGSPCDVHVCRTLFLREVFKIDKPYRLVLLQS